MYMYKHVSLHLFRPIQVPVLQVFLEPHARSGTPGTAVSGIQLQYDERFHHDLSHLTGTASIK